jgi:hypothetical protein
VVVDVFVLSQYLVAGDWMESNSSTSLTLASIVGMDIDHEETMIIMG